MEPNCSPQRELAAKLTEGVNGGSADPLHRAARATSPWGGIGGDYSREGMTTCMLS